MLDVALPWTWEGNVEQMGSEEVSGLETQMWDLLALRQDWEGTAVRKGTKDLNKKSTVSPKCQALGPGIPAWGPPPQLVQLTVQ